MARNSRCAAISAFQYSVRPRSGSDFPTTQFPRRTWPRSCRRRQPSRRSRRHQPRRKPQSRRIPRRPVRRSTLPQATNKDVQKPRVEHRRADKARRKISALRAFSFVIHVPGLDSGIDPCIPGRPRINKEGAAWMPDWRLARSPGQARGGHD